MKTPPLLIGAALLFWGWQTGLFIASVIMALVFESSHIIKSRWNIRDEDFRRVAQLCIVLLLSTTAYHLVSERDTYFVLLLIQWLPIVFFPIPVVFAYTAGMDLDARSLFQIIRKGKGQGRRPRIPFTPAFPFLTVCILSAGAANIRNPAFYAGLFVLSAAALWVIRSKRYSLMFWFFLLLIVGAVGIAGHTALHKLQLFLEGKGVEWFNDFNSGELNPFQTKTAIGDIGALKPSHRIIARVRPMDGSIQPMLLREASYDRFRFSIWAVSNQDFLPVRADKNRHMWFPAPNPSRERSMEISTYLRKGRGVLKQPEGTFQIDNLPAVLLGKNAFGTLKVEGASHLVTYRVHFGPNVSLDSGPTALDLEVPEKERPAVNRIAHQLALKGKSDQVVLNTIQDFFKTRFSYSLVLSEKEKGRSPLSVFLLKSRAGHCEYFATSTVLLLRTVGIPARYAKGYSLHEFSELENCYVLRDRHSHAWAIAHINGVWQSIDTTPANWVEMEQSAASDFQFLADLWYLVVYQIQTMWVQLRQTHVFLFISLSSLPLFFVIFRRLFKKRKKKDQKPDAIEHHTPFTPVGNDSEIFIIEKLLEEKVFRRYPSETLPHWLHRIKKRRPDLAAAKNLDTLLSIHYRYRFDPNGISNGERDFLTTGAAAWIERFQDKGIGEF
jgi:hypothetical protein